MAAPRRTLRTYVGSTSDNVAALLREITGEEEPEEAVLVEVESESEVESETESESEATAAPDSDESESEAGELDESESEPDTGDSGGTEDALERPHPAFGKKEEWYAYRLAQGYTEEELEGLGRNDLRDKLGDR